MLSLIKQGDWVGNLWWQSGILIAGDSLEESAMSPERMRSKRCCLARLQGWDSVKETRPATHPAVLENAVHTRTLGDLQHSPHLHPPHCQGHWMPMTPKLALFSGRETCRSEIPLHFAVDVITCTLLCRLWRVHWCWCFHISVLR